MSAPDGLRASETAEPSAEYRTGLEAAETAAPVAAARLPYTCGRCENRWGGLNTCHCPTCHRNFSTIRGFDAHRSGGQCVDPATLLDKHGERRFRLSTRRLGLVWIRTDLPDAEDA